MYEPRVFPQGEDESEEEEEEDEPQEELLGRGQRNAILASRTRVSGGRGRGGEGRGGEGEVAGKRTEERYPGQSHPGRWGGGEGRGGRSCWEEDRGMLSWPVAPG